MAQPTVDSTSSSPRWSTEFSRVSPGAGMLATSALRGLQCSVSSQNSSGIAGMWFASTRSLSRRAARAAEIELGARSKVIAAARTPTRVVGSSSSSAASSILTRPPNTRCAEPGFDRAGTSVSMNSPGPTTLRWPRKSSQLHPASLRRPRPSAVMRSAMTKGTTSLSASLDHRRSCPGALSAVTSDACLTWTTTVVPSGSTTRTSERWSTPATAMRASRPTACTALMSASTASCPSRRGAIAGSSRTVRCSVNTEHRTSDGRGSISFRKRPGQTVPDPRGCRSPVQPPGGRLRSNPVQELREAAGGRFR